MAEQYRTTGDMARELGVPLHKVLYVLKSREVSEDRRIGNYRMYGEKAWREVESAVKELEEKR